MERRGNPILAAGGYFEKSKVESRRSKVDQLEMGGTNYGNSSRKNLLPSAFSYNVLYFQQLSGFKPESPLPSITFPLRSGAVENRPFVFIDIPASFLHFRSHYSFLFACLQRHLVQDGPGVSCASRGGRHFLEGGLGPRGRVEQASSQIRCTLHSGNVGL